MTDKTCEHGATIEAHEFTRGYEAALEDFGIEHKVWENEQGRAVAETIWIDGFNRHDPSRRREIVVKEARP